MIALGVIALIALLAGIAVARAATEPARGDGPAGGASPAADAGASPAVSASPVAAASASPSAPAPVRVISGGDVMTDRGPKAYAKAHGSDAVLAGIARVLGKGDATWVNLEGPLTTMGAPWPAKTYIFRGPPGMAPALRRAGVDIVTLGNNHAVDYGRSALKDSIETLENARVQVVGAGRDLADAREPAIVTTESGATIGFLAWNDAWWPGFAATGSRAGVAEAFNAVGRMKRDIRALAKEVDYVVVGYHWGIEHEHCPIAQQTSEAHAAIDAGADLVIGHHPHVLQGIETYKRRLIFYSLGDLVFDHYSVETGQTVLVDATLTPRGVTARLVPAYASSQGIPSVQHGASAKSILTLLRQYSQPFGTKVTIAGDTATVRAGGK